MNTADPSRKLLIQMSGPPGSGKSTIARHLAQSINGVVINHDLMKAFFLDSDFSFEASAQLTYRLDWVLAEDMIQQGRSVVIDSVCNHAEVLERGTALAQKYEYGYRYVECRVEDMDLLDCRLHTRIPLRSQRTGVSEPPPDSTSAADGRALFRKWMNPCRPADANDIIVVDSTRSLKECLESILEQLDPLAHEQLQTRTQDR
ncbi:P-loop containing nucleoside triphosphate hydrolase protein [Xylariaceae sp. FL1651]|nr:P-loop containing nucleoside triphosphate hydrolase protein [Xylariaceae sp. FL1651]